MAGAWSGLGTAAEAWSPSGGSTGSGLNVGAVSQREERLLAYLGLMSTQGMWDGSRLEPGPLNSAGH